jgi:hypothetical protein
MRGRLYDPETGRFTTPDPDVANPLASQSFNRYSYVMNNPLRWTDPTGFDCVELCVTIQSPVGSDPSEWAPLSAPPLLTGTDSPPTAPPLLSAQTSDDGGVSSSSTVPPETIQIASENGFVDVPRVPYLENMRLSTEIDIQLRELGNMIDEDSGPRSPQTLTAMFHAAKEELWRRQVWEWEGRGVESTAGPVEWIPLIISGAEFAGAGFELFTAESATVARNPNVYEALFEAEVTGTTRAAHRAAANRALAEALESDSQISEWFNEELETDVLEYMESGRGRLLNPPGTAWHHPIENPAVMRLLRQSVHTDPSIQHLLHPLPGGMGGFGFFYGP